MGKVQDKWGKAQTIILSMTVDKGLIDMDVEFDPQLPALNEHKVNYGVSGNQAQAANLKGIIRKALYAKGLTINVPDGVEEFDESPAKGGKK